MSGNNISLNTNGITKEQFKKLLNCKDGSPVMSEALSLFDNYANGDGVIDIDEQAKLLADLGKVDNQNGAAPITKDALQPVFPPKEEKKLGRINPELITDFSSRTTYMLNRYSNNPMEIKLGTMQEDGSTKFKLNENMNIYKTDDTFRVVTRYPNEKKTNINLTTKYDNGYFKIDDITQSFDGDKLDMDKTVRYYQNDGKEISEEDFYNNIYNFNPELKRENVQNTYISSGKEIKGDTFDIEQNGSILTVNNLTKNRVSTIDFDYLLRDVQSSQVKSRLMAIIQNLPGDALEDAANELTSITSRNTDFVGSASGSYDYDRINIVPKVLTYDDKALTKVLLHELAHALEDNSAVDSGYSNDIQLIFEKESVNLNNFVGFEYADYGDLGLTSYTQILNDKLGGNIDSGYAAKNSEENFAERYAYMMNDESELVDGLMKYFPETFNRQIKHIDEVRNLSKKDRLTPDGNFRLDNIIKPYIKRDNTNKIGLSTPINIVKNSENEYTLFIYQDADSQKVLKQIKFNSTEPVRTGDDVNIIFEEIPYIIPSSITEYSMTNPDVAYVTTIDGQNVTTKRYDRE